MNYKLALLCFLLLSTPVMAFGNSSIICVDNSTLLETLTIDQLNASDTTQILNSTIYAHGTKCQWGCDNTTKQCSPSVFDQNLTWFGFGLGFIILLLIIFKVFA